jgi:heme-degrading monooxygenase HmoA
MLAQTPKPPYYAVIFSSLRTEGDNGYEAMSDQMLELAKQQPGYLGFESARKEIGITVSYWESEEAIRNWKMNLEHQLAQKMGKEKWYSQYRIRVCLVEREYGTPFSVK